MGSQQRQPSRQNPNFAVTEAVARRLGPLLPEFVFVGGCATALLITDAASAPVRVTKDVDVIAEAAYADLGDRLRALGFGEDGSEGAPVCRWTAGDLRLDVMPATGGALGFTNRWYAEALAGPQGFELAPDLRIRLVTGPLFLATKFEAFRARGRGDYYASHDLEDIISVVDGRAELPDEVRLAGDAVRAYLSAHFTALLDDDDFLSTLVGLFPGDQISQQRIGIVLPRLRAIAAAAPGPSPHSPLELVE